jgi:adenylosuccinate lyase
MIELGKKIGKQSAHEVIYEDSMKSIKEEVDFKQVLLGDPRVNSHLAQAEIDRLLNPREYIGLAPRMAREMVALSRKEREED